MVNQKAVAATWRLLKKQIITVVQKPKKPKIALLAVHAIAIRKKQIKTH